MCPRGLTCPPAVTLTKYLLIITSNLKEMCPKSWNHRNYLQHKRVNRFFFSSWHHLYRPHICENVKSISMPILIRMDVMLDFICMDIAELWGSGKQAKKKFKMKIICLHWELNQRPLAYQSCPFDHSVTLLVIKMCLTLSWHMNKINTRANVCI